MFKKKNCCVGGVGVYIPENALENSHADSECCKLLHYARQGFCCHITPPKGVLNEKRNNEQKSENECRNFDFAVWTRGCVNILPQKMKAEKTSYYACGSGITAIRERGGSAILE